MSRSRKHTPSGGLSTERGMKRIANRRIRRLLKRNSDVDMPNKSYKKHFESYDICDWKYVAPSFESFCKEELNRWFEFKLKGWDPSYGAGKKFTNEPPTRAELWDCTADGICASNPIGLQ